MNSQPIIDSVHNWVRDLVVGLNLCPFARRELMARRIRFTVTEAASTRALLVALEEELHRLTGDDSIETTLLIHPEVLGDFYDYNDFLVEADALLVALDLDGIYQIASFHPDYRFAGTEPDAAENYSNRSPWPLLHLLREASLDRAIDSHPDPDAIPARNIALLEQLGAEKMQALLAACSRDTPG